VTGDDDVEEAGMTATSTGEQVRSVAAPVVAGAGLVLESVTVSRAGRRSLVRVVVDLPDAAAGAVELDTVAAVSRALSAALDTAQVLADQAYVLEVTSPGVDRPLTERRHWLRARGRLVRVVLAGGGQPEGRLLAVDDAGVELAAGGRLGWDQVVRGHVQVEFARADGGADGSPDSDRTGRR
jgi:ribosome maturation factor RimP